MENKEQLEQLLVHIKGITKLTEEIYEREIYPVSFFSQAFDITNRMQQLLHQIEISQIELFERQMKEHQAQIQSVGRSPEKGSTPAAPVTPLSQPEKPTPPTPPPPTVSAPPTEEKVTARTPSAPVIPVQKTITPSPPPPPSSVATEKTESSLNETIERQKLSDLRKAFTLNDRFRFCRDLFSRDENLMNQTIAELNGKTSCEASVSFLKERFDWNFEEETVAEFISVLEKRFS
jgi:hypothetical protein